MALSLVSCLYWVSLLASTLCMSLSFRRFVEPREWKLLEESRIDALLLSCYLSSLNTSASHSTNHKLILNIHVIISYSINVACG